MLQTVIHTLGCHKNVIKNLEQYYYYCKFIMLEYGQQRFMTNHQITTSTHNLITEMKSHLVHSIRFYSD